MPSITPLPASRALWFTLALAAVSGARAEDCWHGPSGITSRLDDLVTLSTPPGGSLSVDFAFNALWENELFICDDATHQLLGVRGNTRDRSRWTSPAAPGEQTHRYVFAAFHKTVSASAGDAGDHPWLQSPKKNLTDRPERQPQVEQYGFSDEGTHDRRPDNVLLNVSYNGLRNPPPSVTLKVSPASVPVGGTATLSWDAHFAATCTGGGAQVWDNDHRIQGTDTVQPRLVGPKTYRITCRGSTQPLAVASATVTLDVVKMFQGIPHINITDVTPNPAANQVYVHH